MLARILQDAALTLLGLLTGAMLVVGVALVGYWQSLDPGSFLGWFGAHAHRVGAIMIPLGVAAPLATLASAAAMWRADRSARAWALASALLAILVVVVYLTAHAPRNAAFVAGTTPPERVAGELAIWARWHWIRILLGLAAFWAQLLAVQSALRADGAHAA